MSVSVSERRFKIREEEKKERERKTGSVQILYTIHTRIPSKYDIRNNNSMHTNPAATQVSTAVSDNGHRDGTGGNGAGSSDAA